MYYTNFDSLRRNLLFNFENCKSFIFQKINHHFLFFPDAVPNFKPRSLYIRKDLNILGFIMLSNPKYVCYIKKHKFEIKKISLVLIKIAKTLLNEFYTGFVNKWKERHTPEYRNQKNWSTRNAINNVSLWTTNKYGNKPLNYHESDLFELYYTLFWK